VLAVPPEAAVYQFNEPPLLTGFKLAVKAVAVAF
jgi:hypothetical protein